ncbi:MAG TPA: Ig-like domain repeat protein [Acidobacteriaceae bacterium]|nr:Ig-like domain repeat protein [Acidobacteriaceae bacterium]
MTTIGGLSPMAATAGTQCPNLAASVVSTDAFGDGCLAVNGIFGVGAFSGLVVDPFGNVLVNDDIKGVLHLINPNSGIMTVVAGGGTACSAKQDSSGDGCVAATGTPTTPIAGARGVGIDPYGNVLLAGYNDHFVHIICRNESPLCGSGAPSAANPIQVPVGNLGLVAGCAYSGGATGVTGAGVDNTPAFTLPTAGFSGSPFVNVGGSSSACNTSLGEVDQPRGVSADSYGNVYYADTASERWRVVLGPQTYNGVTNPLWAVLEQNSSWYNGTIKFLTAGYVYTVAGGSTAATIKGASCAGGGIASDSDGDGCLFTAATVFASSSDAQGVGADAAGNMIFSDAGHGLLRVLFVNGSGAAGAAMMNAIEVNNEGMSPSSPQPGFVYSLAGGGTIGGVSAAPALGNSRTALDSSTTKVAVSPQGNIFIGDKTRVLFFDINSGFIRTLVSQALSNVAAGSFCSGSSGQESLSAYSDACPAANAEFGNSNGLSVGADGAGNLYLYDGTSSTTGQLVRKVLAQGLAEQSLGVPLIQSFEVHLPESAAGSVSGAAATLTSTPDMTAGSPACAQNGDNSVDCVVSVNATPSAVGLRSATLTVTLPTASWQNGAGSIALGGNISGSVLVADDTSTTANGVTTPVVLSANVVLSGIVPKGVALDGAGNVYVMDASSGSIMESVQGGAGVAISSQLPSNPGQMAVDQLGDVFAVGGATPSIEELKVTGAPVSAGAAATFTPSTISYTPVNSGTPAPQGIAIDRAGSLYVADNQGSPGENAIYRLTLEPNSALTQVTVATGFANPVSLAVDGSGNVIVADKGAGAVYKLVLGANGTYAQTTILSGVVPVAVATDPAGDVYVQDQSSGTVIEVPLSGSAMPVLAGLQSPTGIAVDGMGSLYSADASKMNVSRVVRNAGSIGSTTSSLTSIAATITNAGNQAAAGTAQTQPSVFTLSSSNCSFGSNSPFASGLACQVSASLASSVSQNPGTAYTDELSFLAAPSIGSISFSDVVPAGPTSMTLVGPANPLFASSGTEATFTVTVVGITSPSGSPLSVTVNSVTQSGSTVVYSSAPTLNATGQAMIALSGLAPGNYTIAVSYAGVTNTYSPSSGSAAFTVEQYVATGDSRSVNEPSIPAVCTALSANIAMVNNDVPASVDSSVSNPDGARIQAALNSCAGTGNAVELSLGSGGSNAFLSGPLSMPSNVTLLVDPGVVLFFSRNVQDYDTIPGTHTCGTVNSNSATSSCLPLVDIPRGATNVGIMGFGKLDGRGGDPLLNTFPSSFAGQSWWGLSSIANNGGNQQNPRFIQMDSGSSNITLYKITLRNSPLFHISTTGAVSNFTAWDIKIVTPTSSRNTDGIDPGNAQNFTITRSWISDGDDNIAVGAAGSAPAANISVTNNRFFAGHGESIGSYTQAGISNVLFDGNMLSGNGIAGAGSSVGNTADSNSTGLRIKSGFDRGGLVTNIQYSNSCFQDHKAEIVFSPNYEATTGSVAPNFKNILMQNIAVLTAGTVQLTGTSDGGMVYPLQLTLDNVSFPSTFAASEFSPAPTETAMTYGPGQVSSDFVSDYASFVNGGGNTVTNNITATNLNPPVCSFTYIAPELTGPNGVPQTITEGENATAAVILTPAVGGAAYPTGTVTLTDSLTNDATTITLPGTTDTFFIPLTGLAPGVHSFTATYSGDSNYVPSAGQTAYSTFGPYVITVNAGSLGATTTGLSGVPASVAFGSSFTAMATISGSNPTGTVEFIVNGTAYQSAPVSSGMATATISLPYSSSVYSIYAVYGGDAANDGSVSATQSVMVTPAFTSTALSANTTTTTLGHPVVLTATVTSSVGAPTGTVSFTYTTTGNGTPQAITATLIASSTPNTSVATAGIVLPVGTDTVTGTYGSSGSFAGSASAPMAFTVTNGNILALPANPIPLPYTMTTIAGGAVANCSSETDSFGDGCPATSILFGGSVDLRSVVADPFGNVYLTDGVASVVRRIASNGVITDFAGKTSGSACAPSATVGCTPTQVTLNKPRGIASDAEGNIYIAGYDSHEVLKVSASTGLLYLVAGTGTAGSSGDGGPATSAQVNGPRGVWADTVGNVYIADTSNNKIRVVDIAGNMHTFAGTGTASSSGDGGLATSATIDNPQGVMTDANLNVYIADSSGGKIRVVCVTCGTGSPLDSLLTKLGITSAQNGYIYTIAGGGSSSGSYPTLATNVSMSPQKLAIDLSGNIYISDGNGIAWLLDAHTANIRPIAGNTSSNCSTATDNFGDGCPALQAVIGDGGNGIGVGTDTLGNLYISDTLNARIRKVVTGLASPATAIASAVSQAVELHFIPGDTIASANGLAYNSNEWSLATPVCATNADSTSDCRFTSSFTPAVPGARSTPLTVNSAQGNASVLGLTGVGLGAGATLDPAAQSNFGSGLRVNGLASDNAGNLYVSDANTKQVLRYTPAAQAQGASAVGTALGTFAAPGAIAVDPRGFVYVADTSAGTVTQISPTGTATPLPLSFTLPSGLAVDALNNLYVSDSGAQVVYRINPITGAQQTLALGRLVSPAGLAIDPTGNLLVADPGAPAIYRFNFATSTRTTVSSSAIAPTVALTDAAGNLLIADSPSILAVPASTNSAPFTVASLTPSALAVDSAGNLYTGSAGGVLKLERTQGYLQFAASSTGQTVNLLESGNQIYSASSFTQTDTTDYTLAPFASTDCALSSGGSGTLAIGGVCALTATYTPTTYATTSDAVTFNGNLSNAALSTPPSVELTLTGPATAPSSTTTLGAFSPAAPTFGQPITLSATVTGAALTPAGTVVFTVDSSTYNATLVNGTASTLVNGLAAGSHSVFASYTSSNGYTSSVSTTATLVVGKATPVVIWPTPAAITYGATLSAMQLDASASIGGTLAYSPAAGTVLGAGVQTLSVLFTPADTTDYQSATQAVQLTVNKAASSVALSASLNPAAQGKLDVLTATVTGAVQPGGIIVFLSGSATLCTSTINSGIATCTFTPTASGTLSITAQYQGDANHLASSASLSLNVYDTSVTQQFSSAQLVYPGATNVTACVVGKSPTPTGTVQIVDGTTVLTTLTLGGNGCAYWYISPGLSAGTHSLTSVYSGNQSYPPGSSAPTILSVSPVPVNMSVSCWNSSFPYGGNYQCTINVSSNAGSAQGNITYSLDGGLEVSVPLNGGNAQVTITKPAAGNHRVTIGYAQQTNYAAATLQAENFTVTPAPVNVSLTPSTWNAKSGTSVTFQAAVASWSAGPPDDNGSVSIYNGSTLLATVPVNSAGQASYITSTLPTGQDTITGTYGGGTNYASGSSSVTITLTP